MSIFKYTIEDESTRDSVSLNVLNEKRTERKFILGVCYWKKVTIDKCDYVQMSKSVGYGK